MTPETRTLYRVLSRIKKESRSPSLSVHLTPWLHPWCGFMMGSDKWVRVMLNPRASVLSTFIHEMLHVLYSNLVEKDVAKLEGLITRKMSLVQWRNVERCLHEALKRSPKKDLQREFRKYPRLVRQLGAAQKKAVERGEMTEEVFK